MRWSITLAFAAAMLVGDHSQAGGDKSLPIKQFLFKLRVYEGDPLGSVEAGTLKLLAEPTLVTLENGSITFAYGGGEPAIPAGFKDMKFDQMGRMIKGTPVAVKDGKIRLDITLSNTTVGKGTEKHIQLNTESTRTITTVKPGEVVKLRWGKGSADKQVWWGGGGALWGALLPWGSTPWVCWRFGSWFLPWGCNPWGKPPRPRAPVGDRTCRHP